MEKLFKMNIAVTGANGYIGKLLVEKLRKQGYNITILVRSKSSFAVNKKIKVIYGDLTDNQFDFESFLNGCDVIVNCAANLFDESKMFDLHVSSSIKLYNRLSEIKKKENKIAKWIQISSVGSYGTLNSYSSEYKIVDEKFNCNPINTYELSKFVFDEFLLKNNISNTSINSIILRPSNIFGPNMKNASLRNLVNSIKKGHFFYVGNKNSILTYVHEDDVVNAIDLCVKHQGASGIYNLSQNCTLQDLVNEIGFPKYLPLIKIPEKFVRMLVRNKIFKLFIGEKLTEKRLNSLVNKCSYSSLRIMDELDFNFEESILFQLKFYSTK